MTDTGIREGFLFRVENAEARWLELLDDEGLFWKSDAYFRLSWRFSLFVSCLKHQCLLSAINDGRDEDYSASASGFNFALPPGSFAVQDDSGCGQLDFFPNLSGISVEIWNLHALHMKMLNDGRAQSYFEALHCLLHQIIIKDFYRVQLFESCSLKRRHDLLILALHCFRHWPNVPLITVELRERLCRHANFPNLPQWFREACSMKLEKKQELRQGMRQMLMTCADQEGWLELADFLLNGRLPNWNQLKDTSWAPQASEPEFCEDSETYF